MSSRSVSVARIIRGLCGVSQPLLVRGTDQNLYVLKFQNGLRETHSLFNECMGSELYRACGLPVPRWSPIRLDAQVIEEYCVRRSSREAERVLPAPGWAFGSHVVQVPGMRLRDVLSGIAFQKIANATDFWLAWLIDACAGHPDHRQAFFAERVGGPIKAVFLDHSRLFGIFDDCAPQDWQASSYSDRRIYAVTRRPDVNQIETAFDALDADALYKVAAELPQDWLTDTGRTQLEACLNRLKNMAVWQRVFAELVCACPGYCSSAAYRPSVSALSGLRHS